MEEIKLLGKLPGDYIVECKNMKQFNEVNQYYYNVGYVLNGPWKYSICSEECKQSGNNGEPSSNSIENFISPKFSNLPVFKYAVWKKLAYVEQEFVLPEKWYVKVTRSNRKALADWRFGNNAPISFKAGAVTGYCLTSSNKEWDERVTSNWKNEITYEQFVKYVLNKETIKTNNMTKENFSIGGSAALKKAFIEEAKLTPSSSGTTNYSYVTSYMCEGSGYQVQGANIPQGKLFILPKDYLTALAYAKDFYTPKKKVTVTEIYFGKLKLTIIKGEDFATTSEGRIYKSAIAGIISSITGLYETTICGYDLVLPNVNTLVLKFGCVEATYADALKVLKAFD